MSGDERIPVAVWTGWFRVLGVEIKCVVLDDGRRVIDGESAQKFVDALTSSEITLSHERDRDAFASLMRWCNGESR